MGQEPDRGPCIWSACWTGWVASAPVTGPGHSRQRGLSIGFERIIDLLDLYDADVPVADALRVARDLRAEGRTASPFAETVRPSPNSTAWASWGFASFVHLRPDQNLATPLAERGLDRSTTN